MNAPKRSHRLAGAAAAATFAVLLAASACGDPGGAGEPCRFDGDCPGTVCCRSPECDGGMCTYDCASDRDCPSDMGCDHGVCFFGCFSDADCPLPFRCKHGHTLCEAG